MTKVAPELHEQLLARAAKGASTRELAQWLKTTHGIQVSHVAVAKILRKHRRARSDVARAVVAEHVAKRLPEDLRELDDIYDRVVGLLDAAVAEAEEEEVALTTAQADKITRLYAQVLKANESRERALGLNEQPSGGLQFAGLADLVGLVI